MKSDKNAATVGLATFAMMLVISALLIWKSGLFFRVAGYEIIGEFVTINGLLPNAEVRYRGYEVGRVFQIFPEQKTIRVFFRVKSNVKIPVGSTLRVVFDGLIGEKYLDIVPNTETKDTLSSGSVMEGYATSGLADFVDVGTQNLQELKAILSSLRETLTADEVTTAIRNTFIQFEEIVSELKVAITQIKNFTSDDKLSSLVDNLNQIAGGLNSTFEDKNLNLKISNTIENMETFSKDLKAILEDGKVKENINETLKESKTFFKGSNNVMTTLNEIDIYPETRLRFQPEPKIADFTFDTDIIFGKRFFRFGFGDRFGTVELFNIQYGMTLTDKFKTRFGLVYSEAGIGIDYTPFEQLVFSLDVFNANNVSYDLLTRLKVYPNLDFNLSYSDEMNTSKARYGVGVSLHP